MATGEICGNRVVAGGGASVHGGMGGNLLIVLPFWSSSLSYKCEHLFALCSPRELVEITLTAQPTCAEGWKQPATPRISHPSFASRRPMKRSGSLKFSQPYKMYSCEAKNSITSKLIII